MIAFIGSNTGIPFIYWEVEVELPELPIDMVGLPGGAEARVRIEDDWLVIETALIEVIPSRGIECKAKLIKRGVAVRLVKPT